MSKNHKRSNREIKKPKSAAKKQAVAPASMVAAAVSASKGALGRKVPK